MRPPHLLKAALHSNKKTGESDSRVSTRWAFPFKRVRDTFETLADEINEELGSHSNRRGADQSMAETPGSSGYAPTFRSGLKPKNVHTIMDCMFGSEGLLHSAGKALSKWTMKIGETTIGGQPPTFDDIESDPDKIKKFTEMLFEDVGQIVISIMVIRDLYGWTPTLALNLSSSVLNMLFDTLDIIDDNLDIADLNKIPS